MVFNFTIESQILYHAPLAFAPTLGSPPRDSSDLEAKAIAAAEAGGSEAIAVAEQVVAQGTDQAWLISEDDVKVFVNSEQWSLGMPFVTESNPADTPQTLAARAILSSVSSCSSPPRSIDQ